MSLTHKLTRTLTSTLLIVLAVSIFALPTAAKGKKGKAAGPRSKGKSEKQALAPGSRLSRREVARRGKHGRHKLADDDFASSAPAANHPVVPDRVEVLEYGSTGSADLSRWLNPPPPSNRASADAVVTDVLVPARSKKMSIDSGRVIQIQQALTKRGFYSGETTGIYDETTVDAMRRFQINNKIAVTGYPTAHSLKRLGLGEW